MIRWRVDDSGSAQDGTEVWSVYASVFADQPSYEAWHEAVWDRHRLREGFRLVRCYRDDGLVGFAYGYTGRDGQWWTDRARAVLDPQVAARWLGGHFEVVSVGVIGSARQQGIGRGLLRAVTTDLPHERLLLMTTADPTDPARRLYDAEGWRVLGPGTSEAKVIMGRRTTTDAPR